MLNQTDNFEILNGSESNWPDGQIPISVVIPFDFGKRYYYAWISYIAVLIMGVVLNSLALAFMFFNDKLKKNKATVYLSYLAGQDWLASVTCLIQCSINLHHQMQLGGSTACIIEAWQVCFFVGISGFSVCLYGFYLRERTLTVKTRYVVSLDSKGLAILHIVAWTIYAVLATGATYWPGRSRLLSSGTYCMPALEDPIASVFFFGLIILPCALFLIINYISIYATYVRVKRNVKDTLKSDEEAEHVANVKLITQFLCFVIVYCVFYLPFLMATCYEWITGDSSVQRTLESTDNARVCLTRANPDPMHPYTLIS